MTRALSPSAVEAAAESLWCLPDEPSSHEIATAAITAYLAAREAEGFVEVPIRTLSRIVEIANRNECIFDIDVMRSLLAAAQNGGD